MLLLLVARPAGAGITIDFPRSGMNKMCGNFTICGTAPGETGLTVEVLDSTNAVVLKSGTTGVNPWHARVPSEFMIAGQTYTVRVTSAAQTVATQTFVWDDVNTKRIALTKPLEGATFVGTSLVQLRGKIFAPGSTTLPPTTATAMAVYANAETTPLALFTIPANQLLWQTTIDVGSRVSSTMLRLEPQDPLEPVSIPGTRICPADIPDGASQFEYPSSKDGAVLTGWLWWPANLQLSDPDVSAVIWLHGANDNGGGAINDLECITGNLETRTWIGIAPNMRPFPLNMCIWPYSFQYYNSTDNLQQGGIHQFGEQDVLDALSWATLCLPVHEDKVHLMGHSQGGRGALCIGLKRPHLWASVGVTAPLSDTYANVAFNYDAGSCLEPMFNGLPHQANPDPAAQAVIDCNYSETSARFLIENAYTLPIIHMHGNSDQSAYNDEDDGDNWKQGFNFHTVNWDTVHQLRQPGEWSVATPLNFGKTPNTDNLKAPGYIGGYQNIVYEATGNPYQGHAFSCTTVSPHGWTDEIFPFFDAHPTRVTNPSTVVYKTYRQLHSEAYWAKVRIADVFNRQDKPACAVAQVIDPDLLTLDAVRLKEFEIDLDKSGLELAEGSPLTIELRLLVATQNRFDPNLIRVEGEPTPPVVIIIRDPDFEFLGASSATWTVGVSSQSITTTLLGDTLTVAPLPLLGGAGGTLVVTVSD